jgi:hypothetical protein
VVSACNLSKQRMNELLHADPSMSAIDLGHKLQTAAQGVIDLSNVIDAGLAPRSVNIAVRVPNPFVRYCPPGGGGWEDAVGDGCSPRLRTVAEDVRIETTHANASSIIANALWSALITPSGGAGAPSSFRLDFDMLYSLAGLTHSLPCNEGAPVISKMAFVVTGTGEGANSINNSALFATVQTDRTVIFPTVSGPESYDVLATGTTGTFNVPIILAHYDEYMTTYNALKDVGSRFQVPFSSSPFTGYTVQISNNVRNTMGVLLDEAPEVYLVFTVDVLPFADMSWIATCH